jgi:hypothetical protein
MVPTPAHDADSARRRYARSRPAAQSGSGLGPSGTVQSLLHQRSSPGRRFIVAGNWDHTAMPPVDGCDVMACLAPGGIEREGAKQA